MKKQWRGPIRAAVGFAVMAWLAGAAGRAQAGVMTVNFSGLITSVPDPHNLLGGTVQVGDPFSGSFTYDTSATNVGSGDIGQYVYNPLTPPLGIVINVGGYSFQPSGAMVIDVRINQPSGPTSALVATDGATEASLAGTPLLGAFVLGDSAGTTITTTALPTSLDLSAFDVRGIAVDVSRGTNIGRLFEGEIRLSAVPEPASAALLGVGIAALVAVGLRRRPACQ
jgi:hypothetical protein